MNIRDYDDKNEPNKFNSDSQELPKPGADELNIVLMIGLILITLLFQVKQYKKIINRQTILID